MVLLQSPSTLLHMNNQVNRRPIEPQVILSEEASSATQKHSHSINSVHVFTGQSVSLVNVSVIEKCIIMAGQFGSFDIQIQSQITVQLPSTGKHRQA